ncbi:MAG: hypothetical protein J4215_02375 [Candidatus Diapherotrites archaeon]|uniref:Uncharacterized protein n=1 Tax=Candidatus Iainarchaeum sp. TaxID=3101447 RepID=A0A8T4LEU2_9ARCH|nr:hypothetical protein [Candidatus Diapherotrites archaeon]
MRLKNDAWLDPLVDGFSDALVGMDTTTLQPVDFIAMHSLYAKEWIDFLANLKKKCDESGLSKKELAKLFPNPSALSTQLFFLTTELKLAKISKKKRLELVEFFYEINNIQRHSNPFCVDGINSVYSEDEIQKMLKEIAFLKATPDIARQLGRLYMAGYHVINGLYSDIYTDFGIEVNGPYDATNVFGKNHSLAIKEVLNLKATELWPQASALPGKDLQIFCVYENVRIKIDTVSAHSAYEGDPINGLTHWAVLLDKKPVPFEKIRELEMVLSDFSVAQWERLAGLDKEKLKQKMLELRCYLFQKAMKKIGLDWKPTRAMKESVAGKPLRSDIYTVPQNVTEKKEYWKKFVDPRIDFYP